MTGPVADVTRYLAPGSGAFWHWAAEGRVLAWNTGETIAFRDEVIEILRRLQTTGLPDFDALVLLLGMSTIDWPHRSEALFGGRAGLPAIPVELRDWRHRPLVAEGVFEGAAEITPPRSRSIVNTFAAGVPYPRIARREGAALSAEEALGLIFRRVEALDPDELILREKTGFDAVPEPSSELDELIEIPAAERARRLIDGLDEDEDLAGIARIARDVMARIALPRPPSEPDGLPQGGVSEITPRGSLDRLLVSELAHDDDTLMLRVALGEALYVRRESPPRRPGGRRSILIDCGIRQWGTPRALGVAVALALTARTPDDFEVNAYRAAASRALPLDLGTREGLVALIEALETDPHPGAALPDFMTAATTEGEAADALLITHENAYHDPGFLRELPREAGQEFYVATVDDGGHLRVRALGERGARELAEVELDVERLVPATAAPVAEELLLPGESQLLEKAPAIFREPMFPLRFPFGRKGKLLYWDRDFGGLEIRHGQLRYVADEERGALLIAPRLPEGHVKALTASVRTRCAIVVTEPPEDGTFLVSKVDLATRELTTWVYEGTEVRSAFADGDVFVVARGPEVAAIDLVTGAILDRQPATLTRARGRMVGNDLMQKRVAFQAQRLVFDELRPEDNWTKSKIPSRFETGGNLCTSVRKIGFDRHRGDLWVVRSKDRFSCLTFEDDLTASFVWHSGLPRRLDWISFEPDFMQVGGASLYRALGPGMDQVFHDARGLLHLGDLTLVLTQGGPTGAWSKTGGSFGNPYFLTEAPGEIGDLENQVRDFVRST